MADRLKLPESLGPKFQFLASRVPNFAQLVSDREWESLSDIYNDYDDVSEAKKDLIKE